MSRPFFDDVIHPPNRLRICATLAAVDSLAFARVREALGLSESVLSKQVKVLQDAGYVAVTKGPGNAPIRTWLALTRDGRHAFERHLAELHRIADTAETSAK